MAEAVVSAIESLDCWLLRKGILEKNVEKLYDLVEEKKEMAHSLLLQFGTKEHGYEMVRIKEKLSNLLNFNQEKMYRLVVWMVDFWEDYKGDLYYLMFLVENLEKVDTYDLLIKIAHLWRDYEGELLFEMLNKNYHSKKKMMCRMSGEMAGLWKDKEPKLNKETLYTWLANKLDLSEAENLFCMLLGGMLHTEIRGSVEGARREFSMILDLIADKKLGEESSLRYFISDIEDIAHDAGFLITGEGSDPFTLFFELAFPHGLAYAWAPEWLDEKLKYIVNGLQEIKDGMLGFGVERLQNVREMEGGENAVGLEEDVELLLCNEGEITVIAGMVGSGKSTLARQLYNHTTIAQQFQRRAWVCFSRMFSRKEILVSLIRQVVDSNELTSFEKIERQSYSGLKLELRNHLLRKRFFIVLDNVEDNTTHLTYVLKALSKVEERSRLLLTTRKRRLLPTNGYNKVNYVHEMKSMDADTSWRLLLKTLSIEGCDERFPKPLVVKARKILMRKCSGLPLAIKEVGRHWAKKRQSGSEWEELIESIDLSETLRALESVYHTWDQELKSRFLHLAFFKEGEPIRGKRLVQIWMVMGVVSRDEEMRQICLEELSTESVIDIDMDRKESIKTCCIHAVFHMLSITKAEDELNFEILNKDGDNRPSHDPHHRVIYCSREKLMNYSSNQDKHLVSLFFYGGGYFNASPSYWKHFEQLKTLDMEDFGLKILPDVIGMLSELRYLGLRNNYIQKLPHSLSRLKKLEVLDIALNSMIEVENIIWEMESLRHLYMSDIICRKPLRIDTLKNLETWTYISIHNLIHEASRLKMMTSLTKLGIQEVDGNTDLSKVFASLGELKNLGILILRGFHFKSMPSLDEIGILQDHRVLHEIKLIGLITRLPSAYNFPIFLWRLSLVNSCLHEDPMPILEKIPHLTYVKLQNAYTGQQMVISCNGFSYLRFLVIKELWHLTNVQIEKGAMKRLVELEINNCPNLETLPEDYFPMDKMEMFKMKTTKKNAAKIRESSFVSRIKKVDIQP